MQGSEPFIVYVVEDNEYYNKMLVHAVSLNPDILVKSFVQGKEVLAALQEKKSQPDVITLDFRLPDTTGDDLLLRIKELCPDTEVIVISEQEDIETAVDLLRAGAYDYMVKSKSISKRLHHILSKIRSEKDLKEKVSSLSNEVRKKYSFSNSLIGQSDVMKDVFQLIEKAAQTNINVSITGATGTGKELVAKAIHYNSSRKDNSFVAVNMAAVPADLVESELFGHEKGAFTGANTRRIGKFEEADQGSLFLDEITEMPMELQAKLLRALQEKEIVRIGSNKNIKVSCRIIVASNRDLEEEVKKGNFRKDLYFRLRGFPIHLPLLKERGKDVLLLAKTFIDGFCEENNIDRKTFTAEGAQKLMKYSFPGNVRELKAIVELAVVMSNNNVIDTGDIELGKMDILPELMQDNMSLREYNRRIVRVMMDKYMNDTKKVAAVLDIGQTTVYRLLKEADSATDT